MSRLPEYLAWLQPKMNDYNELMTKYKSLKEKECAVGKQTQSRKQKKDFLLQLRRDNTLSKEEDEELKCMDAEDKIEERYEANIRMITLKRRKAEEQAEAVFRAMIEKAEACKEKSLEKALFDFTTVEQYYDNDREILLKGARRNYESNKKKIQSQKKKIEAEATITMKTAAEITLEQDKTKILQEMQKIINLIEYSKKSTLRESDIDDAPTVPVLPEPIVTQYVAAPIATPVPTPAPVAPPTVKYDYSMLGEDPATVALRQEMKLKRREKDMEEEARMRAESTGRPPTRYGFIHELEGRPAVKHSYNPPVIEDEPEEKVLCDYFTKSHTSDEES